ncbi:MAG: polysaccharide deacetylase family protein [Candidatus Rokubacteria bacterium]|nr:polysaccharide deacetylase family protein [Candidatus Rokubacteria bacterium]
MRALAKTGVAGALRWTGADRLIGALGGARATPLVVGYHRVVADFEANAKTSIPAMLVSQRMLERHLDWLGRRYRFVPLDELGSRLEAGGGFDRPVAAVTFDDGYTDVYEHALPLLTRKGIPATCFVVTDLVGTSRPALHDRLYLLLRRAFARWHMPGRDLAWLLLALEVRAVDPWRLRGLDLHPAGVTSALLRALPQAEVWRVADALEAEVGLAPAALDDGRPLTWDRLVEMHRHGVTIGSHTRTHVLLANETPERVREETAGAREELVRRLGTAIHHFAYPDGQFDRATVRAVAAAGYRFGYTTCQHRDPDHPLLTIPRRLLWENACLDALGRFSPAVLGCQVNGVFDLAAHCPGNHGPRGRRGGDGAAW